MQKIQALALFGTLATAALAEAQTIDQIAAKYAAETHWQQKCGCKETIDLAAAKTISNADAIEHVYHELTRLCAESRTAEGLKKVCAKIQRTYGFKR